jgi:hypothetical protein
VRAEAWRIAEEAKERKNGSWKALMLNTRKLLQEQRLKALKAYESFEGMDYAEMDNESWRQYIHRVNANTKRKEMFIEFAMVLLVGCATGVMTQGLLTIVGQLSKFKLSFILPGLITQPVQACGLSIGLNTLCLLCASLPCVFLCPQAAGGGIPEVKAYLNGVLIKGAFSSKTFVNKFVSTIFACSSACPWDQRRLLFTWVLAWAQSSPHQP